MNDEHIGIAAVVLILGLFGLFLFLRYLWGLGQ